MKIHLELTEEQNQFLQNNPDFDLEDWFHKMLNSKIHEIQVRSEHINAIIAAAGYEARIAKTVAEIPKAMLKIKGKSLLERQIGELNRLGVTDITVIRGYKKEHITIPEVNYIDNNEYEKKGMLYSFFLASEKMIGRTILLYADILLSENIIEKLIQNTADYAVVVDKSWRSHYHHRVQHTISEAELVEVKDEMVSHIGCDIPYESAYGEFIGLSAFSARGAEKAKRLYKAFNEKSDKNLSEFGAGFNDLSKSSLIDFFNILIAEGEKIHPIDIFGGWLEIDTFEDYQKSWTEIP